MKRFRAPFAALCGLLAARMRYLALLGLAFAACQSRPPPLPLWEGSRFSELDRDQAVLRGLDFIYEISKGEEDFDEYVSDYLWCFYTIAKSSAAAEVQARARKHGRAVAERWRKATPHVPKKADADELVDLAMSLVGSEGLGVLHPTLRAEVEALIPKFDAKAYLNFDPRVEPPPTKELVLRGEEGCAAAGVPIPEEAKQCPVVRRRVPDYDCWYDALITTYFGEAFGTPFGARFADLMRWRDQLHPYQAEQQLGEDAYVDQVYLVTHLVYTHNDYGARRLPEGVLREELSFLQRSFAEMVRSDDAETFAEYVDTLRSTSLSAEPLVLTGMRRAMEDLLARQNRDGSWGALDEEDIYDRYHPTWTAVDALRGYSWERKERVAERR